MPQACACAGVRTALSALLLLPRYHVNDLCLSSVSLHVQLPNGEMTSEQMRFAASCIRPYGEDGCSDITTRANLQLRGVKLEDAGVCVWRGAGLLLLSQHEQIPLVQPALQAAVLQSSGAAPLQPRFVCNLFLSVSDVTLLTALCCFFLVSVHMFPRYLQTASLLA